MTTKENALTESLSVQIYTVRDAFARDPLATLERLAAMGLAQVEPYALSTTGELASALKSTGLRAPTAHADLLGPEQVTIFEYAQTWGVATVMVPFTEPELWTTESSVLELARLLNAAAVVGATYGIGVGYHNHAHEVAAELDGQTALEFFAANLDDEVVLEVDTYWAAVGGQDPVGLLERLGPRVVALHLKDGPITADNIDQVAVGHGRMPIGAILDAAPAALRVIELDDFRGDPFMAIADSIDYLRGSA